jgi:hypothetical protein
MSASPATSRGWQISKTGAKGLIWISFVGPTVSEEIQHFLAALTTAMPESRAKLVFDLRRLEGYNPDTKEPFKAWLLEHKLEIEEVVVVVPKARVIVRMVTAAIALAVGVKIRIEEAFEGSDSVSRASP